jgi:AAHS family 4-hydroxybenzoate transporter-like MFS transporter
LRRRTLILWAIVLLDFLLLGFFLVSQRTRAPEAWTMQAAGMLGGVVLALFMDRGRPRPALLVAFAIAAVSVMLLPLVGVTVIAGVGLGIIGTRLALNALAADFYPAAIRSRAFGWLLAIGQLGSLIGGAWAVWFLAPQPQAPSALATSILVLCAACLATLFIRRQWRAT